MRWLGFKRIAFTSIKLDAADIRRRAKEPHVKELAADIKAHGEEPIQAPTIRMPGKVLLCGRDRMAALSANKATRVWVHVAQCDDHEAKELELSENIYRRADNRAELIAQLVALKEQQLTAEAQSRRSAPGRDSVVRVSGASNDPDTVPGRRAIRAEATKQVARGAGITPDAVRADVARAAAKSAPAEAEEAPDVDQPEPTLNLLGVDDDSTRAVCKFARPQQDAIDEADKHLRLALGALKPIEHTAVGQRLRAKIQQVGESVRSERPESICPSCKGLPKAAYRAAAGVDCPLCHGEMFVSAERAQQAAPECFRDPPLVFVNGRYLPYADVRFGKVKAGAPAKAEKKISVVDEHDNPFALEADLEQEMSVEYDDEQAY